MLSNFYANQKYFIEIQNSLFYSKISTKSLPSNVYFIPTPDEHSDLLKKIVAQAENIVFIGCCKTGLFSYLASIIGLEIKAKIIGYNEIPFFSQFPKLEFSLYPNTEPSIVENLFNELEIEGFFVEDSPGFVAPRVISMIVNEAAFMVNEQIADFNSIDIGMKLGTNYPMGPSEWLEKIGIDYIYNILLNLHHRIPTGRYKISPYLQKLYHLSKIQSSVK